MSIFIGSSSEAKSLAGQIVGHLEREGHKIEPWWKVFNVGEFFVESLDRTAHRCDAAILICTPDDQTVSRGKEKQSPRDNVVFEAGFFLSRCGRFHVLLAAFGNPDVPTDVDGLVRLNCGSHKELSASDAKAIGDWARKFSSRDPSDPADALHVVRNTFNAAIKAARVKLSLRRLLNGEDNIELPHTAYLHFLREILVREGTELQAIEAITSARAECFRQSRSEEMRAFTFAHLVADLHWHLPETLEGHTHDNIKLEIVNNLRRHKGARRTILVPPADKMPALLKRRLLEYVKFLYKLPNQSKLQFVELPDWPNEHDNSFHVKIGPKWYSGSRVEEKGRFRVKITESSAPAPPERGTPAKEFVKQYL